ncbi:hypothetical protein AUTU_36850 [Aureibacter tunicatorum]|nr:hypothetical protein AUTU_36850 [Aureibacter tunicatorum]
MVGSELRWYEFSDRRDEFIPLIDQNLNNVHLIGAFWDERASSDTFCIHLPANSSVYLNNSILWHSSEKDTLLFPSSGFDAYFKSGNNFVSIYNPDGLKGFQFESKVGENVELANGDNVILERKLDSFNDFFFIVFFTIIFIEIIFRNFFSRIGSSLWYKDLFSIIPVNEKVYSNNNFIYLIILCLWMALFFQTFLFVSLGDSGNITVLERLMTYFYYVMVLVLFGVVKLFGLALFSRVLNLKGLVDFHLLEYSRVYDLMFFIFVTCMAGLALREGGWHLDDVLLIKKVALFIYFSFLMILYYKMIAYKGYKKLQLFLYLCASEFLPFLVGMKFFLKI